jgi:hypothetical protein
VNRCNKGYVAEPAAPFWTLGWRSPAEAAGVLRQYKDKRRGIN